MKQFVKFWFVGLVTFVSLSCGFNDSSPEYEQRHSNMTFNGGSSGQTMLLGPDAVTSAPSSNLKTYSQLNLLAQSASMLEVHLPLNSSTSCEPRSINSLSSAQLVSPSRLITAHHNIRNLNPDQDLTVTFGGSDGTYWRRDPFLGSSHFSPLSPNKQENPLLPNRLWQIGLEGWAPNYVVDPNSSSGYAESVAKSIVRKALMEWDVELDVDKGQPNNPWPWFNTNTSSGKDIAVLKVGFVSNLIEQVVGAHDPSEEDYVNARLRTSPLLLDQPGLFYEQLELRSMENDDVGSYVASINSGQVPGETYTQLNVVGTVPWMDTSGVSGTDFRTVIDVDFYAEAPFQPADTTCSAASYCPRVGVAPVPLDYEDCFASSADRVKGGSGSSFVLNPAITYSNNNVTERRAERRYSYGVFHGSKFPGTAHTWQDNVTTANNLPDPSKHTLWVGGDEAFEEWGKRHEGQGDPEKTSLFEPLPFQPETDGSPECQQSEGEECISYTQAISNPPWGEPEPSRVCPRKSKQQPS